MTLCLLMAASCAAQDGRRRLDLPGTVPHDASKPHLGVRNLTGADQPLKLEPPESTDYHDPKYKLSFKVPPGWMFERKDGLLSNFSEDTHAPHRGVDVRGVAAINYNPYPITTFASANFYFSVQPHSSEQSCAEQTRAGAVKPMDPAEVDGVPFQHGHEQHGQVCTESRDEIFTALRGKSCYRFDLVVNTFCSATSGAMEITPDQLDDVDTRLAGILGSVKFEEN
jgi:hypothetical protein